MNEHPSVNPNFVISTSTPAKNLVVTMVKIVAGGFVAVTILALLLPSTNRGRGAARRTQCKNNLKQIALALHNYESVYHELPPAYTVNEHGLPLHSWRTLILPYLDQQALYDSIDLTKPWDDPVNALPRATIVGAYYCPSMSRPAGHTTYCAVSKPESCLLPSRSHSTPYGRSAPGEKWMVIEVMPEQSRHWMSPIDAGEEFILALNSETKMAHPGGTHVACADGTVQFVSASMPVDERRSHLSSTESQN
jgi:hypothetical protein